MAAGGHAPNSTSEMDDGNFFGLDISLTEGNTCTYEGS